MEKICIVKRRREYTQTEVKLVLPDNLNDTFPRVDAISSISIDTRPEVSDKETVVKLVLPDNLSDNTPQEITASGAAPAGAGGSFPKSDIPRLAESIQPPAGAGGFLQRDKKICYNFRSIFSK